MKLEHFGMAEPGDCRVVFSAAAEELEAAVQAEKAAPDAPQDEDNLLTAAVNRAILEGFSPLFAQLRASGRGRSSSVCRRWNWESTPALPSPSSPGLSGS